MTTLDITVRKQSEALTRVKDAISAGRSFKSTSASINERVNDAIPASLPFWAKQYLRGLRECVARRVLPDRLGIQISDARWPVD